MISHSRPKVINGGAGGVLHLIAVGNRWPQSAQILMMTAKS